MSRSTVSSPQISDAIANAIIQDDSWKAKKLFAVQLATAIVLQEIAALGENFSPGRSGYSSTERLDQIANKIVSDWC
jgi:hypothetical protein